VQATGIILHFWRQILRDRKFFETLWTFLASKLVIQKRSQTFINLQFSRKSAHLHKFTAVGCFLRENNCTCLGACSYSPLKKHCTNINVTRAVDVIKKFGIHSTSWFQNCLKIFPMTSTARVTLMFVKCFLRALELHLPSDSPSILSCCGSFCTHTSRFCVKLVVKPWGLAWLLWFF